MIKNILYVEDGSIDLDAVSDKLNQETLIIPYRQGAVRPTLVQLETPIKDFMDAPLAELREKYDTLQEKTAELLIGIAKEKKITKRAIKKIETFGNEFLGW